MGKKIIAAALVALGMLAAGSAVAAWSACFADALSGVCLAAADAHAGAVTAVVSWTLAIALCGIGLFVPSARIGSAIGAALLVIVNPLTDPGFFWAFDSADATPGKGIIAGIAIIAAGAVVARPWHAKSPRRTGGFVVGLPGDSQTTARR